MFSRTAPFVPDFASRSDGLDRDLECTAHCSNRVELVIGAQASIVQFTLQNLADAIVAARIRALTSCSGTRAFSFSLELSSCCA